MILCQASTRWLTIRDETLSGGREKILKRSPQGQRRGDTEGNELLKRRRWRGITMRIRTHCQQCQNTTVPFRMNDSARLGVALCAWKRAIQSRDCCAPVRRELKKFYTLGSATASVKDRYSGPHNREGRVDPLKNLISEHRRRVRDYTLQGFFRKGSIKQHRLID